MLHGRTWLRQVTRRVYACLKQQPAVLRSSVTVGPDLEHFSTSGKKFWLQLMGPHANVFYAVQMSVRGARLDRKRERAF